MLYIYKTLKNKINCFKWYFFFFLQRRHHKIKNESIKHTKNVTNKILIFKFKLRYI